MSNKLENTVQENNKGLVVAFQKFNGVFLAKIKDSLDRSTHAYGKTKAKAEYNAITNYRRKYHYTFQNL